MAPNDSDRPPVLAHQRFLEDKKFFADLNLAQRFKRIYDTNLWGAAASSSGLGSEMDATAALRAVEIGADVLLKATKVDGIYSADPNKVSDATRLANLTYLDVLNRGLAIMDSTAVTLCMDNRMPIIVFDLFTQGNIERVILGEQIGTRVDAEGDAE